MTEELKQAFDEGWRMAAEWAVRDDLVPDMESPQYAKERYDRLAALPAQQAAQTDSMGLPTSCGKPLCSPDEHHPLCKLHKPAAQATPEPSRHPLFAASVAARKWAELQEKGHRMQSLQFDGGPGGAGSIDPWGKVMWATPEPVGEPALWVLTMQLDQRETTTWGYLWFSNPQNDSWTPLFTRPAPGVPAKLPSAYATSTEDGTWRVLLAFDNKDDAEATRRFLHDHGVQPRTMRSSAPGVPEDSELLDYLDTLATRAAGSDLHCFGGRVALYVRTGIGSQIEASGAGTAREAIRAALAAAQAKGADK